MKTLEELEKEIWERYGNFELSHIKNESIVANILEFILKERKSFAQEAIKADRENIAKHAKVLPLKYSGGTMTLKVSKIGIDKNSIINAPQIELL